MFKLTSFPFHRMVVISKLIQQFRVIGGDGLKIVSVLMNHGLNKLLHTGAVVIENRHPIFNGTVLTIGGVPTCLLANANSELGPLPVVNTKVIRTITSGQLNNLPNGPRVQRGQRGVKPNTTAPHHIKYVHPTKLRNPIDMAKHNSKVGVND